MTTTPPSEEWEACEPGEVQGLVQRLHSRKKAEKRQVGVVVSSAVLLCLFVGSWFVIGPRVTEANYGGIVCSQVKKHAAQFVQKKTSPEVTTKIETHIAKCQDCRNEIEKLLAEVEQEQAANERRRASSIPLFATSD